jgi:hypothetical protein
MLNNIKEKSEEVTLCNLFGVPLKREKVEQSHPIPGVDFFTCQNCAGVSNEFGVLCAVRKSGVCGVARRGLVISSPEDKAE